MAQLKSEKPLEAPEDPDPVSRLLKVLPAEGFHLFEELPGPQDESIYRRTEKVLFAEGETVFVVTHYPVVTEKIIGQAVDAIKNLFIARRRTDKVLSVFQTTTVYVCIVARSESPHNESLNRFITSAGGAVIIPVVIVPEINQVVYPSIEEKLGVIRPRIEYLQYVLGERQNAVNMHKQTIQTFYISVSVAALLALGVLLSIVT